MDGKSNPPQLEALSYPWNVPVIVIYSLTAFVSLCSNLITVVILLKGEHLSTELWKFLLNLCIADIIMSIFCTEFTYTSYMLGRWIFPQWSCALISCIQCTSVTVSIYSLGVIGLDRYFAILYPFHPVPWLRANKVCLIVFIWVIGIAISSPLYANMAVEPFWINDTQYFECIETWSDTSARLYTVFLFLFTFLIPIVALTFVYSRICLHMWRNTTAPGNPDQRGIESSSTDGLKYVIKMLVTIVVMFFICWAPTHVFQLLVNFNFFNIQNQPQTFGYYTYVTSYFFIHWLSQAHCLVNPFVYCFMSDNFRFSLI
ncbi:hypothetical protein TYRP_008428 [Tyrophagus putrescentiae]|nr:hypothetical protein TYRP_008428 [Tyrophagus putrescentiae]